MGEYADLACPDLYWGFDDYNQQAYEESLVPKRKVKMKKIILRKAPLHTVPKKFMKTSVDRFLFQKKQLSAWNFWDYGVSISFLQTWLQCRRTAELKYIHGWRARITKDYTEFGNIGHDVFDQAYALKAAPSPLALSGCLNAYHKRWLAFQSGMPHPKASESQQQLYAMHRVLLPRYFKRWDGDFTGKYSEGNPTLQPVKWLSREQKFKVPFAFSDGRQSSIQGKWDGLFEDRREDLWLFETKFKGRINEDEIQSVLPADMQVVVYLWTVMLVTGRIPKGVLYNVVRRPGTYRRKNETNKDYFDRVEQELARKGSADHYFMRYEVAFTKKEIIDWIHDILHPMMKEVRMWWEGELASYPNPESFIGKFGLSDYFEAINNKDFSRLVRSKRAEELFIERL